MSNKSTSPTKVIVPCRISFANIWEAKSINGGEEKYSVSCLIPKEDKTTLMKIHKAVEEAKEAAKSKKWGGRIPPNLKLPLRDGDIDRPDDEAYKGSWFINANSDSAPGIVDADRNPIMTRSEMYSGVKGRASINLYAYNVNGNRGIACGLNNLQKIADGMPLGGKSRAEDDFATEDEEDFLD